MLLKVAGIGPTILPKSVMNSFPLLEIEMMDFDDTGFQYEVGVVWLQTGICLKVPATSLNSCSLRNDDLEANKEKGKTKTAP